MRSFTCHHDRHTHHGRHHGGHRGRHRHRELDLQTVILAQLAAAPSRGHELIKALELRAGGFVGPGPSVIYPMLTYLAEIGRASVDASDGHPRYQITEAGRQHLLEQHSELHEARRDLKNAMIERADRSPEERRRVATILARAAAEIRGA